MITGVALIFGINKLGWAWLNGQDPVTVLFT